MRTETSSTGYGPCLRAVSAGRACRHRRARWNVRTATTRKSVRFRRRGTTVEVSSAHAVMTLLDWLRLEQGLTGTKEGCAEGGCGACTVVLARTRVGKVVYEPVNACMFLTGQADGAHVITIEDSGPPGRPAARRPDRHDRAPRLPVRLLHAGDRHEPVRPAPVGRAAGGARRGP